MTLEILDVEQGTEQWHAARRGIITASVVGKLITPATLKVANNETSRAVTLQLTAERITGYTDPTFPTRDMERGTFDEPFARDIYSAHYAPAIETGFMIRDDWGFKLGYSPDGLVGEDGAIEIKSRNQKAQLATILSDTVPLEHQAQIQCGLLVSGRSWLDYVSYASGMHLYVKRVYPDPRWHEAIISAAEQFEATAAETTARYEAATTGLTLTPRIEYFAEEMVL